MKKYPWLTLKDIAMQSCLKGVAERGEFSEEILLKVLTGDEDD